MNTAPSALYFKLSLAAILLIGLFFIQYKLIQPKETQPAYRPAEDYIDEYAHHTKMRRFNKSGQLIQQFQLNEWAHYHDAGIAYFSMPTLVLHSSDITWSVHAKKGQAVQTHLGDKLNTIQLSDDVEINHVTGIRPPWRLSTDRLQFLLNENRSFTDRPVRIKQSSLTIDAVGAEADLDKGTIHLNEKVKTVYTQEHV
jgi:LPS export ABC transporter protein LptC